MLKHAFGTATEGVYLRKRSNDKLFNVSRLKAKTRVQEVCLRNFLFADDAAVTTHTEEELQQLMQQSQPTLRKSSSSSCSASPLRVKTSG